MPYANDDLLVSPDWLAANLGDPQLCVVDTRPADEYAAGHIPGAVNLPDYPNDNPRLLLTHDYTRGTVAGPEEVAAVLGELGITPETTVVLYDAHNGYNAARVFWVLEYYGHPEVWVLNCAWSAWEESGYPVSTDAPAITPAVYPVPQPDERRRVSADWIAAHLDDPAVTILDVRNLDEYRGEREYNEGHAGRIPGCVFVNWRENYNEDMTYKTPEDLAALYAPLDLASKTRIVTYCQIGYRASATYLALRLLGYDQVALYDTSWSEWGRRDDLPYATGA